MKKLMLGFMPGLVALYYQMVSFIKGEGRVPGNVVMRPMEYDGAPMHQWPAGEKRRRASDNGTVRVLISSMTAKAAQMARTQDKTSKRWTPAWVSMNC